MTATEKIDEYINKIADWRGELLKEIREIVLATDKNIVEEWKWNSPVWSCNGLLCSAGAFKKHVSFTFFQGSSLDDNGLFNSGTSSKNNRSINFNEGDTLDTDALKDLVKKAVEFNKE